MRRVPRPQTCLYTVVNKILNIFYITWYQCLCQFSQKFVTWGNILLSPNNFRTTLVFQSFLDSFQNIYRTSFETIFFLQYKPLLYLSVLIFGINKEIPVCCSLNEISVNGSSDINYFQKSEKLWNSKRQIVMICKSGGQLFLFPYFPGEINDDVK